MFVFISHLSVPEADRPALERHFRERAHLVDSFPGFLYLQLLVPQSGEASYTFLTAWESRQALSASNPNEKKMNAANSPKYHRPGP